MSHKERCPACAAKGRDLKHDNLVNYGEGKGKHCFSCGYTELSDDERERRGIDDYVFEESEVSTREAITDKELEKLKGYTNTKGQDTRGISDETYKHYAVRFKYDEETGDVSDHYYPYFSNTGKLEGFKVRTLPKTFSVVGKCDNDSMLFGQFRWKNSSGKYVLITAGEIDCMSAFQMLEEYRKSRNSDFEPIPVVSAGVGETASPKQIQKHYEWLNNFERIVVCYDNDEAGKKAVEKLSSVLPRNKMFVMKLSLKDANKYLEEGREKQFINLFYNAPAYTPSGIVASNEIYNEIVERSKQQKLPFAPVLDKLNKMLAGGINYGYIVNILAGSGAGKSSLINQNCVFWMTELNIPILVASLEAEAAEFGENLLSYQMGKKIAMINDQEEKIKFVGSKEAEETAYNLFNFPDGTPRLYLLDDRGDYSKLQEKIEEVVISCGVKVVVIDVISDIFAGMSIEQIDLWMAWEKKFVKQYNCILIQVAHTRKGGSQDKSASQGKFLTEESIIGSGTQYRSAGINIALQRDKTAEDHDVRNTTTVHLLKSRATGMTGVACELYYDVNTHTLHDKEEWLAKNPSPDY